MIEPACNPNEPYSREGAVTEGLAPNVKFTVCEVSIDDGGGHRSFPFIAGAAIAPHDDCLIPGNGKAGSFFNTIQPLPVSHDVVAPVVMLEADIADPNFRKGDGGHRSDSTNSGSNL